METKYVNLIGVELEGGWDSKPPARLYGDGSVSFRNRDGECCEACYNDGEGREIECDDCGCHRGSPRHVGELCSPPMNFDELKEFIKANCPSHVNESCGLHVHVSFKSNFSYLRLMVREFYDFFLDRMEKWAKEKAKFTSGHAFWGRFNGNNHYCKKDFQAEKQVVDMHKNGTRYCHLNYCYALHGTIECRLFPGLNNPNLIISAVEDLIMCYEDYLDNTEFVLDASTINIEVPLAELENIYDDMPSIFSDTVVSV